MKYRSNHLRFICPHNQVIYAPDINVGIGKELTCKGLTPGLVQMKYDCSWQNTCKLKWNGPTFVTMADKPECHRRDADILGTEGFKCIFKGN